MTSSTGPLTPKCKRSRFMTPGVGFPGMWGFRKKYEVELYPGGVGSYVAQALLSLRNFYENCMCSEVDDKPAKITKTNFLVMPPAAGVDILPFWL